jgi:hypothetical protein
MDEAALAAYLDKYLSTRYSRLLDNRFFRGKVVGANPVTVLIPQATNYQGGYTVSVLRPEAATPDADAHLCITPGYVPQVGDDVECVWRDAHTAYVLWAVNKPQAAYGTLSGGFKWTQTSQGSITSLVTLSFSTAAVIVPAMRLIRITGVGYLTSTVAGDDGRLVILEDGTPVQQAGSQLGGTGTADTAESITATVIRSPLGLGLLTPGAHTYSLAAERFAGSGTLTNNATTGLPSYLLVEDIGTAQ